MSTSSKAASRSRGAAARAEGRKKTQEVEFEGEVYEIPAKAPFKLVRYIGSNLDIEGVLQTLLGPERTEEVWEMGLDLEKGRDLVYALLEPYDLSAGE